MSAASDQLAKWVIELWANHRFNRCDCEDCLIVFHEQINEAVGAIRQETVNHMREHGILRTYEWINEHG